MSSRTNAAPLALATHPIPSPNEDAPSTRGRPLHHGGKPRIGLALGSGAARGWAHIGVLHALTEAGIRPDVIAGCSVGALVGGCFAAGHLSDVEAFSRSLTKRRILGLLDFQIAGAGLIGGERLRALLDRDLKKASIESLAPRFGAVATELSTGHEVWLTKGSLVEAIRASYALPGIFEPVTSDGRVLMDGALVNPIPVTLARALGADVVICVNLNGDPRSRGTVIPSHGAVAPSVPPLPPAAWWNRFGRRREMADDVVRRPAFRVARPASVLASAFNITQDRIARSRLAGDPPDMLISPRLAEVGLFEFHRASECIELGRRAAEKAMPDIVEILALHGVVS